MRFLSCLSVIVLSCFNFSCSSTSEGDADIKESIDAEQTGDNQTDGKDKTKSKESNLDCSTPPVPVMCCQAMTTACNDCRENSRRSMEEWRKSCDSKLKSAGCGAPPVVNCCKGPAEECRTCREETQIKIKAWRKSCGTKDAIDCDDRPTAEQCCNTGQPSCDACRKRIDRLLSEFSRKCVK